jgi:hypothetical protein
MTNDGKKYFKKNNNGEQPVSTQPLMTEEYKKQLDELIATYNNVCLQYPGMKSLKPLLKENIIDFKKQYAPKLIEEVSTQLGIPASGVDILDFKPYINKTALFNKVQTDKRQIKVFKAYPVLLAVNFKPFEGNQERDNLKYFLGTSEEGTVMYRAVIEFDNGEIYEDDATANVKYLTSDYHKKDFMQPYVMELASTRAKLRVARMATGIGLISAEDINERGYKGVNNSTDMTAKKIELIDAIDKMFEKGKCNQAKRIALCHKYGTGSMLEEMSTSVLENMLNAIREAANERKKPIKKKTKEKNKSKK